MRAGIVLLFLITLGDFSSIFCWSSSGKVLDSRGACCSGYSWFVLLVVVSCFLSCFGLVVLHFVLYYSLWVKGTMVEGRIEEWG